MLKKYLAIHFIHFLAGIILLSLCISAYGQSVHSQNQPDSTWIGQRIIMLQGFGEVNAIDTNGNILIKEVPNIVAPVSRCI